MASITHLRPRYTQAGAERVLAEVRRAIADSVDLGDRRPLLRDVTADLRSSRTQLLSAVADLHTREIHSDPETARRIRYCEGLCADLLGWLDALLQQADAVNAQLALRKAS